MKWGGLVLLVALFGSAPIALAAEDELIIEQVDVAEHPQVVVSVAPPPGIGGQGDLTFSLTEGGQSKELRVELAGSEDLEVLLLIDTSGSMAGEPIQAARQAALAFVERMPDQVQLGVAIFGSVPSVVAPIGVEREAVRSALEGLDEGGETALYDGVTMAIEQFGFEQGRRTIVLLSDGGDTVSTTALEEVTARLIDSGVQLHVVELQSPEFDSAALHQLANAGGGAVVPVSDPTALSEVYEDIATQLVHRYRISYTSDAHGLTELEVRASTGSSTAAATFQVALPAPAVTAPLPVEENPESAPRRQGELMEVVGLRSPWALYVGAAIVYVGLAIGLLVALSPRDKRNNLLAVWKSGNSSSVSGVLTDFADRATSLVEKGMEERGGGGRLNSVLEQAGVLLRPAEFLVFAGSISIAVSLVVWVWGGVIAAVAVLAVMIGLARLVLTLLRSRRQQAFADQLDDSLQLLAGSLRAGYGILQAIDALSREAERPTADELRRVVLEARLGRNFHDSLHAMAERLRSVDFKWVVDAIQIHGEVGGDLSEVLDNVGETIRDRNQVRRQIKALSAEGKLSAVILLILPFAVGILISLIVPGYIQELFTHAAGIAMLIVALILMIIGAFWIKKIVKVVF